MYPEIKTTKLSCFLDPQQTLEFHSWGNRRLINTEYASLTFEENKEGGYKISNVKSEKSGEGSKIVREFVKIIGPNQQIVGEVIEPVSQAKLLELGYLEKVKTEGEIELTDTTVLRQIKVIRLLEKGGIKTQKLF